MWGAGCPLLPLQPLLPGRRSPPRQVGRWLLLWWLQQDGGGWQQQEWLWLQALQHKGGWL